MSEQRVLSAANTLAGIVIAFMYPAEMRTPTYAECDAAVKEYDEALTAAAPPRDGSE